MKKILSVILFISLFLTALPVYADSSAQIEQVEYLPDGSCFVTVLDESPAATPHTLAASTTETKSKTTYYKNAAGTVLWWVRVTGTFTYGNGTSKCTSVKASAASEHSAWKVSNISESKSGNTASGSAKGTQYTQGIITNSITKTVTLKCSPTGVFS